MGCSGHPQTAPQPRANDHVTFQMQIHTPNTHTYQLPSLSSLHTTSLFLGPKPPFPQSHPPSLARGQVQTM